MWETVASTGVAFQRADLSRGLSAAEIRRQAARWWWRWLLRVAFILDVPV